jgi:hypothetical protein
MNSPFQAEPSEEFELYSHDGKVLGILHQNINAAAGERCYGVLAFHCGNGRLLQVPVQWAIINYTSRTGRYVAAVNHSKLMDSPRFEASGITGFDFEFASNIDAAFGLEFPGIESMNDLARCRNYRA